MVNVCRKPVFTQTARNKGLPLSNDEFMVEACLFLCPPLGLSFAQPKSIGLAHRRLGCLRRSSISSHHCLNCRLYNTIYIFISIQTDYNIKVVAPSYLLLRRDVFQRPPEWLVTPPLLRCTSRQVGHAGVEFCPTLPRSHFSLAELQL